MISKDELAKKLGMSLLELDEELREDRPDLDAVKYAAGLRRCETCNPEFSREEIAAIVGARLEEFDACPV